MRDALAPQGHDVAGLDTRPDLQVERPVEGVELDACTQGGCRHRELDRAVQVIAAALEGLMGRNADLDIQVTGRARSCSDLALAGELDPGAGVDPCRDAQLEVATGADATLARTLETGVGDDDAVALAGHARTGCHDLAQEGPLDLLDLASSATDITGARPGARLRSIAVTGPADDRRVHRQLSLGTEDGLGEVDVETDQGVLAPALTRTGPT